MNNFRSTICHKTRNPFWFSENKRLRTLNEYSAQFDESNISRTLLEDHINYNIWIHIYDTYNIGFID